MSISATHQLAIRSIASFALRATSRSAPPTPVTVGSIARPIHTNTSIFSNSSFAARRYSPSTSTSTSSFAAAENNLRRQFLTSHPQQTHAQRRIMSASAAAAAAAAPSAQPVTTTLLVVTSPSLVDSIPIKRLLLAAQGGGNGDDAALLPTGAFDVRVGATLADFPRDVLDSAEGNPVALLFWFGDSEVLRDVLRSECAKPKPNQQGRVAWVHSGSAGVVRPPWGIIPSHPPQPRVSFTDACASFGPHLVICTTCNATLRSFTQNLGME